MDRDRAHDLIDEFYSFSPEVTEQELLAVLQALGKRIHQEIEEGIRDAQQFEVKTEKYGEWRPVE